MTGSSRSAVPSKRQNQRLRAARDALCTALGREPTLEELAAQIGVSCEEAAASMAADSPVESLSAPASAGEETGLLLQESDCWGDSGE